MLSAYRLSESELSRQPSTYDASRKLRPARSKVGSDAVPMDSVPLPSRHRPQYLPILPPCPLRRTIAWQPMSNESRNQERTFGYLTTTKSPEHGYFGGYLIVSVLGRPQEFHCTAPIRPSRAQQILYGPTLEPYLLGEQICGSLLEVAKLTPCLIMTDCEAALHARPPEGVPMVLVTAIDEQVAAAKKPNDQTDSFPASNDFNAGSVQTRMLSSEFTFGAYQIQLPLHYEREQKAVVDALTLLVQHVDLAEPFARIHDAIREAQRIGGRGTEVDDQAA